MFYLNLEKQSCVMVLIRCIIHPEFHWTLTLVQNRLQIWQLYFDIQKGLNFMTFSEWLKFSSLVTFTSEWLTYLYISFNPLFPATSCRLIHTDVTFPKYHDDERSKVTCDSRKAARDTEDYRRATAQGLLLGGQVNSISLTFCHWF